MTSREWLDVNSGETSSRSTRRSRREGRGYCSGLVALRQPLRRAPPLAHRLLHRERVRVVPNSPARDPLGRLLPRGRRIPRELLIELEALDLSVALGRNPGAGRVYEVEAGPL